MKMFDLGPIVQMHHFLGCLSLFLVAVSDLVIDSLWEIYLLGPANRHSLRKGEHTHRLVQICTTPKRSLSPVRSLIDTYA